MSGALSPAVGWEGALLWALVLLPAVAGGVLTLSGGGRRPAGTYERPGGTGRTAPALAVAVAAVTLALAVAAALTRPSARTGFVAGGPLALAVDGLSAVVIVTVAAVGLLVLVFAAADVRAERPRFFGLMLLFVAAVLVTATATTLTALLLAWEVMGATSYALIAFHWRANEAVAAGTTAFLTTRAGDLGLYLAAGAALAAAAGAPEPLSLDALAALDRPWLHLAAVGVLAAAFGKAAQLPFSFWLSKAMLGPSPVSALLHSAAMVAMGGYLLLRLRPLLEAAGWATTAAAWGGALTALALGAVALAQPELKQLLAASTAAQLGFVVLAAGAGGLAGGTAHFAAHAAVKALLFLAAGHWLATRGTDTLSALRGAARRPWPAGLPFVVGALALAGVPPLSLWATKDEILAAVDAPALYGVTLAAVTLSALYAGKALGLLLRPAPTGAPAREPGPGLTRGAPLALLALGAAVLGALALPPLAGELKRSLGVSGEPSAGPALVLGTAVLALVAALLAAVFAARLPEPGWARAWLHLGTAAHALAVRPTLTAAHALARFDDAVLHRAALGAAGAVRRLAAWAWAVDRSGVDRLVQGVADGTRRLGELARRPQTGQLHHYYAQALTLLAAAVLLLLLLR
ncbi:proton-conducting transporter transmembrane domain-containing protein [Streptomyces sp. WMMC897]|uniref:proton-conducting transporter transmembrane domain-containing protein n=1 Tax=Streptomyces sp. WMMC897 TaxID=3014782 RepID=UPI0022B69C4A|nr:proton-conducting transporter membrane subunit [Streptomyces sp. WMMC897]MCZ7416548.1 proton-conducting transporter membrane subunit [Streptomyces sp. WMMC897]